MQIVLKYSVLLPSKLVQHLVLEDTDEQPEPLSSKSRVLPALGTAVEGHIGWTPNGFIPRQLQS
jgi:hypothetical protein